jgi:hypothetical protein
MIQAAFDSMAFSADVQQRFRTTPIRLVREAASWVSCRVSEESKASRSRHSDVVSGYGVERLATFWPF